MEYNEVYRKLTTDGSIYMQMGQVIVKDAEAVLDMLEETAPDDWPISQSIVFFVLAVQHKQQLDPSRSMELWLDLEQAARELQRAEIAKGLAERLAQDKPND